MGALLDIITKGSTDRSVSIRIIDSADGTPETAVAYDTTGIDLWYRREGAAKVSITEATLAALTTAHADGGFLHISDGVYRLDLPDAAFATGANYVDIGGTVPDMVVIGGRVRLVDTNLEVANIPANVTQFGGSNGTFSGGRPEVNATHFAGTAFASAVFGANIIQISGDSTAADNAEAFFDGTGYAGTNNVIPTVATITNGVSLLDGAIAPATFGTGAITAAAAAADFVAEIADGVWDEAKAGHTTAGSTGKALIDTETAAAAAELASEAANLEAQGINTKIGTPSVSVSDDIAGIKAQTDTLGTPAGASHAADIAAIKSDTGANKTTLEDAGYGLSALETLIQAVPTTGEIKQALALANGTVASTTGTATTLDAGAVANADYYVSALLVLESGTGVGQERIITAYTVGRVATHAAWDVNPDSNTTYTIRPGRSSATVSGGGDASAANQETIIELLQSGPK